MGQPTRAQLVVLWLGSAVLASCGSGTLAIFGSIVGGDDGNHAPPLVSDVLVGADAADARTSPVSFSFRLTDAESNPIDVDVFYLPPGGGAEAPLVLTGNTDLDQLDSSPGGTVHVRVWDFGSQIASGDAYAPGYRIVVRSRAGTSRADSAPFAVGNDAPVASDFVAPATETAGIVPIAFELSDSSSDPVSVTVEYQDVDIASGWKPATSAAGPLADVATAPGGVPIHFFWDAPADQPQEEFRARLRFTPDDGTAVGAAALTAIVTVDNNAVPAALVNGSAFYATPDDRRGIPLPIRILDPEGDSVRVVVQWREPFGTFPELPADPGALDAILSDPNQRLQHQIATETPIDFAGRIDPLGTDTVRLPEISASQAGIHSEGIAGRRLQVLRTNSVPVAAAAGWGSNPLNAPVAVLPLGEGHSGLVLDSPSSAAWRLREIDLATGAIVADLATGGGDPNALAWEIADEAVLVASDAAGIWTVQRVDVADGSTATLLTTSGATAVGPVRGLASTGVDEAVLAVANSLVAVDATAAGSPTETAIVTDLQGAWGLALDPHDRNRLYVAERDWVNPSTSSVEGHVVAVDLLARTRRAVAASGAPFLRPDSIAIDPRSGRLLVLTDANTSDGTREIRCVDSNGGGGGTAFQLASGIPNGCRGLAAGPDGLRLLALTPANDLSIAGGVEQARTITAFDPATMEATVDADFAPALVARRAWRIASALEARPATGSGIDHAFVWDSSDLIAGGEVILRAVPYDTERGLPTDTGVPRRVRPGLDVLPYAIGSVASTSAPASIAAADLNQDGRLDLATANVGADDLTLFFQSASGVYSAAPSATLTGVAVVAPLTDPASLKAIDVDLDGDLDVVSANRGSNNLIVWTQGGSGAFSTVVPASGGLTAPSDVAGADLNGDGRMDLVAANTGANRLAIYFRGAAGTYPGSPSLSIGNASTGGPASVAVADLDGDGDIDIASANQTANNLSIFYQTAPGTFPAIPSTILGGAGITAGPVSLAVGDVDGDGRPDIACADRSGNDLTVFLQGPAGGFSGTPAFTLSGTGSPLQPAHVEIGDVNDDGALDLISANGGNDVSIFAYRPAQGGFATEPMVIGDDGSLAAPAWITTGDFDGDGRLDLATCNSTGNDVAVFKQLGGASYSSPSPDLVLGNAIYTSDPQGIAIGDLDGDGDLDLVSANEGASELAIFEQQSPAVFASKPAATLGSSADTPGVHAVAAADLDGDGRLDLVSANRGGGTLSLFYQDALGEFPEAADRVIGGGTLGSPTSLATGDFDGDGRADVASANASGNNLAVFVQVLPNGFVGVTPRILGGVATTRSPTHVLAADLDADGDLDLVSANTVGNNLTLFLNPGNGVFPSAPSLSIGGAGTTPSPRALAVADLDRDGDLDIASANGGNNSVAVFLQTTPGSFPAAPNLSLTHASLLTPDTLAAADVDHDGDADLVSGNTVSRNLTIFRQGNPGTFGATPMAIGGAGATDTPRTLHVVDLDGDGDLDLVTAEPALDNVAIYFASH